jgi:serine/threonine protein phosphatase 1
MKEHPQTPQNMRLYAVGDLHGRCDLLVRLLAKIEEDALAHPDKKKKLVFLGDYVDRGLDSKGVIERLLGSFAAGLDPIFLRGNHDDMFLSFLKGHLEVAPLWLEHGGTAAAASYGVNLLNIGTKEKLEKIQKELSEKVPAEHIVFLENTIFSVAFGDYFFVHAGVRPGVPLNKQKDIDKIWIRSEFLNSGDDFGIFVIHGHSVRTMPEIKSNRIDIDTGAFATGQLTCLVLDDTERVFLTT